MTSMSAAILRCVETVFPALGTHGLPQSPIELAASWADLFNSIVRFRERADEACARGTHSLHGRGIPSSRTVLSILVAALGPATLIGVDLQVPNTSPSQPRHWRIVPLLPTATQKLSLGQLTPSRLSQ